MLHDIRIAGFGEGFLHELVAGHDFVNIHFSGWLVLGDDGSGSFLLLCGPDIVFLAGMPNGVRILASAKQIARPFISKTAILSMLSGS